MSSQNATTDCRALVFSEPGQPLSLQRLKLPQPCGREVLVRVTCCTLCGSDVHTWSGRRSTPVPTILGHEIVGRIAGFGKEAERVDLLGQPLHEGDRVTWTLAASCKHCFYCTHALPQKCERLFKYGHERLDLEHTLHGGLADYCLLRPGTGLVRLPDELADHVACPANCAVATVAATLRVAGGCRDQCVLVQGAGMLGLTACAMAREDGAQTVICSDVQDERLAWATRFGATAAVRADRPELEERVREATGGRGVDLALEVSGSIAAIHQGLRLLRIGGRHVWVGAVAPTLPLDIAPETVVRRHLTLLGVHNYAPQDLATALRFLMAQQQRYPIADLVGRVFPLEQAEEALRYAATGKCVRVAVRP